MGASVTRVSCSTPASRQKDARRENNACCTFKKIELGVLQTTLKAQTRPSPGLDRKGYFYAIT